MFLGLGLGLARRLLGRASGPALKLTPQSVDEDANVGDLVGLLSVIRGGGVYTYSITSDPDSKFSIDGNRLELADTVDFATAASHSVTIEADNGVEPPLTRTFTIRVNDVFEPPLEYVPTYYYLGF